MHNLSYAQVLCRFSAAIALEGQHHRIFWFILLSSMGLSVWLNHQHHRHECFVAVLGGSLALSLQSGTPGVGERQKDGVCNLHCQWLKWSWRHLKTFWWKTFWTERFTERSPFVVCMCWFKCEWIVGCCGQVGMFGNSHDDDGRIKNLRPFEHVGDLDQCLGGIPGSLREASILNDLSCNGHAMVMQWSYLVHGW